MMRFKKNIAVNSLGNITTVEAALRKEKKTIDFYVPIDDRISDTGSGIKEFSESTYKNKLRWESINVSQHTIDIFFSHHPAWRQDLIKIDVEGYEINVFEGAQNVFLRDKPIILCEIFLDEEKKFISRGLRRNINTIHI